jgi:hypothetical protein
MLLDVANPFLRRENIVLHLEVVYIYKASSVLVIEWNKLVFVTLTQLYVCSVDGNNNALSKCCAIIPFC